MWRCCTVWPELRDYLPVGGAEALIKGGEQVGQRSRPRDRRQRSRMLGDSLGWMGVAILGAWLTALPVSWVYMATRTVGGI